MRLLKTKIALIEKIVVEKRKNTVNEEYKKEKLVKNLEHELAMKDQKILSLKLKNKELKRIKEEESIANAPLSECLSQNRELQAKIDELESQIKDLIGLAQMLKKKNQEEIK